MYPQKASLFFFCKIMGTVSACVCAEGKDPEGQVIMHGEGQAEQPF